MSSRKSPDTQSDHEKRLRHLEAKTRRMYLAGVINSITIIVLALMARRSTVVVINNTPKSQ